MIIDLVRRGKEGYTRKIEKWMVFAGHDVAGIEHWWNQHGRDNMLVWVVII
jgi:hypothetical protein